MKIWYNLIYYFLLSLPIFSQDNNNIIGEA